MSRRVAVLGGGISGLVAAYRLVSANHIEPVEVVLYEANNRLGGVIRSDLSQGVVLEGGPDSLLKRKPEALELVKELGLADQIMGTNPHTRGAYIFHRGHFHDIPPGVRVGIPTRLDTLWTTELLALGEKLRLWGDLVLPRRPAVGDQSLGSLLRYRFGDAYVDRIAAPILAGIYAGDIDRLSLRVTAPQLLTYQSRGPSLIREVQRAFKAQPSNVPLGGMFVSLTSGIESLVTRLAQIISQAATVHLGEAVNRVTGGKGGYVVHSDSRTLEVTDVVVALPAYRAAHVLTFLDESARKILLDIPYADLAVVGAVYDESAIGRALSATGYLVPRGEGIEMTAGTFVRAKWDYPDHIDFVPIRAFYGRAGQPDLLKNSDDQILARFRREMGYVMGVTDAPRFARVFRSAQGMPQYLVGHREAIERLRTAQDAWPGLKMIGAYWDGVGVPDCIRHANEAISELLTDWSESPNRTPLPRSR